MSNGTVQGVTINALNGGSPARPCPDLGGVAPVRIGRTLTGPPGSPARVANLGSPRAPFLAFSIPRGREGQPGIRGYPGPIGPPGPQGPPGTGLNPRGEIETEADLPTVGNQVGDMYLVRENGVAYVWHGTGWQTLGELAAGAGPYLSLTGGWLRNPSAAPNTDTLIISAIPGNYSRIGYRVDGVAQQYFAGMGPAGHFAISDVTATPAYRFDIDPIGFTHIARSLAVGTGNTDIGPGSVNASAYYINGVPFTGGGGGVGGGVEATSVTIAPNQIGAVGATSRLGLNVYLDTVSQTWKYNANGPGGVISMQSVAGATPGSRMSFAVADINQTGGPGAAATTEGIFNLIYGLPGSGATNAYAVIGNANNVPAQPPTFGTLFANQISIETGAVGTVGASNRLGLNTYYDNTGTPRYVANGPGAMISLQSANPNGLPMSRLNFSVADINSANPGAAATFEGLINIIYGAQGSPVGTGYVLLGPAASIPAVPPPGYSLFVDGRVDAKGGFFKNGVEITGGSSGAASWGSITGTLTLQTDLNTRLTNIDSAVNSKQNTLISGTTIKTINTESLLGAGNITITGGPGGGLPETGGSLANPSASTTLTLDNAGGILLPQVNLRQANNTLTSPSPVTSNVQLGLFQFQGWNGVVYGSGANIYAQVASGVTWGTGNMNSRLIFQTCRQNSSNLQIAFQVGALGGLVVGTASAGDQGPGTVNLANLYINGTTLEDYIKAVVGI